MLIVGEPRSSLVEGLMVQETITNNTQQLPAQQTGAAVTTQPPPQPGDTHLSPVLSGCVAVLCM